MGRQRREFKRISGTRDASLFVIATEGQNTEPKYFEALRSSDAYANPRIHVKIIKSEDGKSSPKYMFDSLNEFKREFRIREDDEE